MALLTKNIIVQNKKGLHARPAAMFVQMVSKHDVQVTVAKDGDKVNGKSIMGLLTLGAIFNATLLVTVEGQDAYVAMAEIESFFNKQEETYLI